MQPNQAPRVQVQLALAAPATGRLGLSQAMQNGRPKLALCGYEKFSRFYRARLPWCSALEREVPNERAVVRDKGATKQRLSVTWLDRNDNQTREAACAKPGFIHPETKRALGDRLVRKWKWKRKRRGPGFSKGTSIDQAGGKPQGAGDHDMLAQ